MNHSKFNFIFKGDRCMNYITVLDKTENSIIYQIPSGKPDPNEECTLGKDERKRIWQPAYKDNTCSWYTMNFLRKRIGKKPCKELQNEREFEKLASKRRKELSKLNASLPYFAELIHMKDYEDFLKKFTKETAKKWLNDKKDYEKTLSMMIPEECKHKPSLFPELEQFQKSELENLYDYFFQKKYVGMYEINLAFFKNVKCNIEERFNEDVIQNKDFKDTYGDNWKKLPFFPKMHYMDQLAIRICHEKFGLKPSSWVISDSIESLIDQFKEHGPLSAFGRFGSPAYKDKPFKTSLKIKDRDIYGWKPNAIREEDSNMAHCVLLIGANSVGKGLVYFIDCADPSDPDDPSIQKIYAMSFKTFTSNLYDSMYGFKNVTQSPHLLYGTQIEIKKE